MLAFLQEEQSMREKNTQMLLTRGTLQKKQMSNIIYSRAKRAK